MNIHKLNAAVDRLHAEDERMKRFSGYILMTKNGETLLSKGYGLADYAAGGAFDPDTVFLIGSLTKVFTSACVLMLQESGRLDIRDRVGKYLPQYKKGADVTIAQLLAQTSGIPDYWNRVGISSIDYNDATDIFRFVMDFDLIGTPGDAFCYSNSNYLILAIVIETITGMSYEAFLRQNILDPLEMRRTGCIPNHHRLKNVAVGYKTVLPYPKEAAKPENTIIFGNMLGAGCLYSSAGDLMKFCSALFEGRLLDRESMSALFSPNMGGYGYGWFIEKDKIWCGGDICGFSTRVTALRPGGTLIVTLCNSDGKKEAHMGHFSSLIERCLADCGRG